MKWICGLLFGQIAVFVAVNVGSVYSCCCVFVVMVAVVVVVVENGRGRGLEMSLLACIMFPLHAWFLHQIQGPEHDLFCFLIDPP